jgi:hypothetical protein
MTASDQTGEQYTETGQPIIGGLNDHERPQGIDPELIDFIRDNQRMPFITDERRPWTYRGFALPIVQAMHRHPRCNTGDRWGYYAQCLHEGRLIPHRLPQVYWKGATSAHVNALAKLLNNCVSILEGYDSWDVFKALVQWIGWALSTRRRPPDLFADMRRNERSARRAGVEERIEKMNAFVYQNLKLDDWLITPDDHLGNFLAEQKGKGWNPHAFYPTPMEVCQVMAQLTYGEHGKTHDLRGQSACDPCIGTGRTMLVAADYSMRVAGQDIDGLAIAICYINGALYAPWITFPLPDRIFKGWVSRPWEEVEEQGRQERLARYTPAERLVLALLRGETPPGLDVDEAPGGGEGTADTEPKAQAPAEREAAAEPLPPEFDAEEIADLFTWDEQPHPEPALELPSDEASAPVVVAPAEAPPTQREAAAEPPLPPAPSPTPSSAGQMDLFGLFAAPASASSYKPRRKMKP